METYGDQVRTAPLVVTDKDAAYAAVHIQGGKGRVDRDVILSLKLLEELREPLAPLAEKAQSMAVSRQPLAQWWPTHRYENTSERLQASRPASGP